MSTKHRIPQGRERQLRDRALFHEAGLEKKTNKVKRKTWKHDGWDYKAEQLSPYPALIEAAAESLKVSRVVSGSRSDSRTIRQRFTLMKKLSPSQRLVSLVLPLHEADHLALKTTPTVELCEVLTYEKLAALGADLEWPHCVALKRGGHFAGTHAHVVFAAEALGFELLALAEAAESGAGGGALHSSGVHVCIVGDTEKDLDMLAAYFARDGDEALHHDNQDSPQFLAALSRKVSAQVSGVKSPALIWHHPHHLKTLEALLPLRVY